jgi:hypothetical protein
MKNHTTRTKLSLVIVCLIVLQTVARAADAPGRAETIKPDAEIQAIIDNYRKIPRWTPEFYVQLTALQNLTKQKDFRPKVPRKPGPPVVEEQRHVIQQAAYYFARSNNPPPREDPNGLVVNEGTRGQFRHLMHELGIPEYQVMAAILPYIDTPDEWMRNFIRTDVLEDYEPPNGSGEKDDRDPVIQGVLQYMQSNVLARNVDMPWSVVQILYSKAPTTSLHYFCKSTSRDKCREAYLIEHMIQEVLWRKSHGLLTAEEMKNAIAELDKLSQFDDWAVKLYVAEMVRHHDEFRDSEIIERLRSDNNALVSKAVDVPPNVQEK